MNQDAEFYVVNVTIGSKWAVRAVRKLPNLFGVKAARSRPVVKQNNTVTVANALPFLAIYSTNLPTTLNKGMVANGLSSVNNGLSNNNAKAVCNQQAAFCIKLSPTVVGTALETVHSNR